MKSHSVINRFIIPCLAVTILFTGILSCRQIDLYEKSVSIPGHAWKSGFKPAFTFTIKDTVPAYRLYVILRHNDRYNYNNIYINLITQQPGEDSTRKARYGLELANADGWLASGMDDIYEHRIALTPLTGKFYFRKAGDYTFTIEQIMREDPLKHVLNVGLRIEKEQ